MSRNDKRELERLLHELWQALSEDACTVSLGTTLNDIIDRFDLDAEVIYAE